MFSIYFKCKRKYHVSYCRILIVLLAAFCWLAALSKLAMQIIAPYSSHYHVDSYKMRSLTSQTYEIVTQDSKSSIQSLCSDLLQDDQLQTVYKHEEKRYKDYYFYSPTLEHSTDHSNVPYNVQIAVTDTGHIYMGFPQIDYDF